jgi:hypothetical protein
LRAVGSGEAGKVGLSEGIPHTVTGAGVYQLTLKHLEGKSELNILFHDLPGGWVEDEQKVYRYVTKLKSARIVLVAVNVPALMTSPEWNERKNKPEDLTAALRQAMAEWPNKSDEPRLVLYVLMKGERWLREGRGHQVLEHFERHFAALIRLVSSHKSTTAAVICPIQTLGAVRFAGFDENGNDRYERVPGEGYKPVDCDQPLRYTLAFLMRILNQYAEARHKEAKKMLDNRGFFERMKDSALGLFNYKSDKQKAFDEWCDRSTLLWKSVSTFASGCKHPKDPLFKVLHTEELLGTRQTL